MNRALLAAAMMAIASVAQAFGPVRADEVDHFVLALSWSPTYCLAERARAEEQCDPDADHTFIVHGLWPNLADAKPDFCASDERAPLRRVIRDMLPVMPDVGLIHHQWRKHGTCSGLSSRNYFRVVREALARVKIPARYAEPRPAFRVDPRDVREAFLEANPTMPSAGIHTHCRDGRLREMRICLSPSLDFVACPDLVRPGCRSGTVTVPAPP